MPGLYNSPLQFTFYILKCVHTSIIPNNNFLSSRPAVLCASIWESAMTNFLSLGSVYTPPSLGVSDAVAKEPHHINSRCLAISTRREGRKTYRPLSQGWVAHTCKNRPEKPIADRICHFGLTGAFVEFACLCDIPFAQSGSLANRWSDAVHIVAWQDSVQEDASVI